MPHRPLGCRGSRCLTQQLFALFPQRSGQRQSYEGMIELGYILQLSQKLALQPGVQVIVNPDGTGDNETLVVPGMQVSFNW